MAGAPTETMAPIVKSIVIDAPRRTVFETFVARFGTWWPRDRFARGLGGVPRTIVLEAHMGGAIFELADNGDRLDWGTVIAIERDRFIKMQWHLGRPVETVVAVGFEAIGPSRTRVILTHSGWEKLEAAGATVERAGYDRGWDMILAEAFAGAFPTSEPAR